MGGRGRSRLLCAAAATTLALCLAAAIPWSSSDAAVSLAGTGLSTNYDFAHLVLRDGGWPVSANNVTVLTQWLRSEEPTSAWWDRDNPLNNGLGSGGGSGLGSYSSVVTAAYDVARNLENPGYGYPQIARDLRLSMAPSTTARAIWRSSWAAGHYGFGADWGTSPVPAVPAPPSAWRSPTACPIAYPAGVVGPCGRGFTTRGGSWNAASPQGIERQALWAFASGTASQDTATWSATLAAGTYDVSAFLPATFDDAIVTYAVTDATGTHRVRVDQEPYSDAWVPLGEYEAAGASGITVLLASGSAVPRASTYVAADAMRFLRAPAPPASRVAVDGVGSNGLVGVVPHVARPGAPQSVAAVAGDAEATVSWLAPSKDGGAPLTRFTVTSVPGGRTCARAVAAAGVASCTVAGLTNGVNYQFVVRAVNRVGVGAASAASSPVRPLGVATLVVEVSAHVLRFGQRVVYRATVRPALPGGTVLFAENGRVVARCTTSRVVDGSASCATRLATTGHQVLLVRYTGNVALAGTQFALPVFVGRAPTSMQTAPSPRALTSGATVTLHAWKLPGLATGRVVFATGATQLCVASVASGGATCTASVHLAPGLYAVRATYLGTRDFKASVARTSLRVLPASAP